MTSNLWKGVVRRHLEMFESKKIQKCSYLNCVEVSNIFPGIALVRHQFY